MNLAKFYDAYKSSVVIHIINGRAFVSTDAGKTMVETPADKVQDVIIEFCNRIKVALSYDA